ncbi:MAG: DUF2238 domain-containing protein [Verrucomicrobiota bacterium]
MGSGNRGTLIFIASITTVLLFIFGLIGHGPSTYRLAILFLGPFLWFVYWQRERLNLHPVGFAVFAAALLVHDLGAFGMYGHFYFGLEFDTYVHYFFGLAGASVVARALAYRFGLSGWRLWVGTILLIMGVGALHELMEWVSTMLLGSKGMLKLNDPDKFDTQKDLGNNFLGTLTALLIYGAVGMVLKGRRKTPN